MQATPTQDSRHYFVLPQGYEGGGYYTYGTPSEGRSQYTHPRLMSLIQQVAFQWCGLEQRKFGIGNISLANGIDHPDHSTHESGLEVDIRVIRKDGRKLPCSFRQHDYDQAATAKLIELFLRNNSVKLVYFNDVSIRGVRRAKFHDDHFHVALY